MIKVQLSPLSVVSVSFSHPNYRVSPMGYTEAFERQSTRCNIYIGKPDDEPKDMKVLSMGIIKHYYKDKPWSKEKRRVLALTRALDCAELNRDDHAKIWSAYHSRPRTVSSPKPPQAPPVAQAAVIIPFPAVNAKAFQGAHSVVNKLVAEARVTIHDRSASELTH